MMKIITIDKYPLIMITLLVLFSFSGVALAETVPFTSDRWVIRAEEHETGTYDGEEALTLKGGIAYLEDVDFLNGIIEFDIAIPEQRGFMGAIWRLQDEDNYEEFYLRPHQSGNPDANQYTPVFNGLAAWQLYHGEGYGTPAEYKFNEWMHIKIVMAGNLAEIYIMDMNEPALLVNPMKHPVQSGRIGVEVGNFAPGRFANFSYTKITAPDFKGKFKKVPEPQPGTVMSWQASNPFPGDLIRAQYYIEDVFINELRWVDLNAESTGITNIARVADPEEGNTVIMKVNLVSDTEQIKRFRFGFSDKARIYLNGLILYSGDNTYRSRDYRYLGTIGLFDEVYLPLKEGQNEILIAVTEQFGGWGVQGLVPDPEGIHFE